MAHPPGQVPVAGRAGAVDESRASLATVRLVDHHCHSVVRDDLDLPGFEALLTEAHRAGPPGSTFDTLLGLSVRRWCAPLLDLAPGAVPAGYVERRLELGTEEVSRRFLRSAGVDLFLVDSGYNSVELISLEEMAKASGSTVREIARLETIAESVAGGVATGRAFLAKLTDELALAATRVAGFKSVVAYRCGLALAADRPSPPEVAEAATRFVAGTLAHRRDGRTALRLADPVLCRHLLWCALELGLPVQVHTGFGDDDEDLWRCDPSLLTSFIRASADLGTPIVLLHCYPYHRQAAYLSSVFPNVYLDLGLTTNFVGRRAGAVLAETLELAPFHKLLFSSDGYGLAELHYLGALGWARAVGEALAPLRDDALAADAEIERIIDGFGRGNAFRVYRLGAPTV